MATALLKFSQLPFVGPDGEAIYAVVGSPVDVANVNNVGVGSWQLDLVSVPIDSALVVGTLAFGDFPTVPAASFTPDADDGSYRIVLTIWNAPGRVGAPNDTDIRNVIVKDSSGLITPPQQIWPRPLPPLPSGSSGAKPNEMNISGQERGWAGTGSDGFLDDRLHYPRGADGLWQSGGAPLFVMGVVNDGELFRRSGTNITGFGTGGLVTAINVSAGTTSNNLTNVVFSNANNVSFGLNGSTVTASASFSNSTAPGAIAAGTQTATSGTVFFANSNGVTFGMSNSSQITASYTVPSTAGLISFVNLSAGTTSNNSSAFTFGNANNVSFGLDAGTLTASASYSQSTSPSGIAASNTTYTSGTVVFTGSNAATVRSTTGQAVVIDVPVQTIQTQNVVVPSAGTQTATSGTVVWSNSNNITFGMSGSTHITASYAFNFSAGTTSNNLNAITFSNSNNVSFGLNGSIVTATASFSQTNQTLGLFATGNTTQNSSTTLDARSITFNGLGIVTVGFSNGSVQLSVSQSAQTQNVVVPSAGTQTATSGTVVWSNSNNITFGMSGSSRVTASYAFNVSGGTTSNNLNAITFSNSNGISFGLNGSTMTASVATSLTAINLSAGTTSNNGSAFVFSNSNGLSFGLNGSTITGSYTVPSTAGLISAINLSAGTTSNNLTAFVFSNSNNVSFGLNGSTVTATATFSQTNQTLGLFATGNTTQNSSTALDARSLTFNGLGNITIGFSNGSIQVSGTQSVQTQNVVVPSAGTQTATSGTVVWSNSNNITFGMSGSTHITASYAFNVSAGTTSNNLNAVTFSNSNGVSFGLNGSTITGSVATSLTAINISAGTTSNNGSAFVFSNSNNFSFGLNGSTVTGSFSQSNQQMTLFATGNTTQSSTGTTNASSIIFAGSGVASVGITNGSIVISVPAGGGGITNINISAGTTSNNLSNVTFSNSNGVSFGLNGSTVTASVAAQSNQNLSLFALGNTTQNSSTVLNASVLSFNGLGAMTWGYSNGSIQASAPATSSLSATGAVSISTNGSTISIGAKLNISAGTTSNNLTSQFVFSNSNGISFGLNGSTITASGGYILSTYEPYPIHNTGTGAISAQTVTSNSCSFWPFVLPASLSAGMLDMVATMNFVTMGTSSGRQSATYHFGIYSRGTGANSTTLGSVATTSFGLNVTYNNSTISISQPTTSNYTGYNTGSTTSAGLNITSGYTGLKRIQVPMNTLLTPGVYWLGIFCRESTSSNSGGIKATFIGNQLTISGMGPIGSFSSAFSTGTNLVGMQNGAWLPGGVHTSGTTVLPASLAISQFTNNLTVVPYMKFVRT